MSAVWNLQKLLAEFQCIVVISTEDGIARLLFLAVEGFHIFLASVAEENPVAVEDVRRGYEAKGLSEDCSLSWSEAEGLVEYLVDDTVEVDGETADVHATEFDKVCESLCKRQESQEFLLSDRAT